MRKYLLLFIPIVLVACQQKDEKYLEIIRENNKYLKNQAAMVGAIAHAHSMDRPAQFPLARTNAMLGIIGKIEKVTSKKEYLKLKNDINLLFTSKIRKYDFYESNPDEVNIDKLKNTLYLNFLNFSSQNMMDIVLASSCGMPPNAMRIRPSIKNDTVTLDFVAGNPYQIVLDSVKNKNGKVAKIHSEKDWVAWKVTYPKPADGLHTSFGKIFLYDNDRPELLNTFETTYRIDGDYIYTVDSK